MSGNSSTRFEAVALSHLDLVYRVARCLAGNAHEAEDLTQETFLRAHRAFSKFDLRAYGAKPWLLRILHNVYLTRRGQSHRGPSLLDDVSLDDFASEIEQEPEALLTGEDVNWEEFDEEVKAAVEKLPSEYKTVLLLWSLGDLSYKEIAHVLECAMGTVMSRLYRARQMLNASLAEYARRHRILPRGELNP